MSALHNREQLLIRLTVVNKLLSSHSVCQRATEASVQRGQAEWIVGVRTRTTCKTKNNNVLYSSQCALATAVKMSLVTKTQMLYIPLPKAAVCL